jgi:hypothetical protein
MSMLRTTMIVLALAACTRVPGTEGNDPGDRGPGVIAPTAKPATVTLMSVTFGDDCGGTPPAAPVRAAKAAPNDSAAVPAQDVAPGYAPTRYRCQQTSMQLSIAAKKDSSITIKSVEVLDEKGASLGTLGASKPTRWSETKSAYDAWDQNVASGQTALISYVLSQPSFVDRWASHDRMYTVKVTASVGGVDQALQTTVMVVAQPAPVPT